MRLLYDWRDYSFGIVGLPHQIVPLYKLVFRFLVLLLQELEVVSSVNCAVRIDYILSSTEGRQSNHS